MKYIKNFLIGISLCIIGISLMACSQVQENPLSNEDISRIEKSALSVAISRTFDPTWKIVKQEYDKKENNYVVYMSSENKSCKVIYDIPLTNDMQGHIEEWDGEE